MQTGSQVRKLGCRLANIQPQAANGRVTINSGAGHGPISGMHARGPVLVLAIGDSIARRDLQALDRDACRLLERSGAEVLYCDVRGASANAVTVEALARLALAARRLNRRIGLLGASGELRELIALMGLGDVLLS